MQTFKTHAFSERGQLALYLQDCCPFDCKIHTPPVPHPAGSVAGQVNPTVASHCPLIGLQRFLSQLEVEGVGQGVTLKTHFPEPESQVEDPHPVAVQLRVLLAVSLTQVGTPFGEIHFLREHGESPGQEIWVKVQFAFPLTTVQISLVHGSLSSHTLLFTVPHCPVKGSQTLDPQGPVEALQLTGLVGVHTHFPSVVGVGTIVAHLLLGQVKGEMRQVPFSHLYIIQGLGEVQFAQVTLLHPGMIWLTQLPVAVSQKSLVHGFLSLQSLGWLIHPFTGSQKLVEQRSSNGQR